MKWNNKLSKDEYFNILICVFKDRETLHSELKGIYNHIQSIANSTDIVNDDIINSVLWIQESIALEQKKSKKNDDNNETNYNFVYLNSLEEILTASQNSWDSELKKVQVIAFYILCTHYRREKNYSLFETLIKDNSILSKEPIYKIQSAYYYSCSAPDDSAIQKSLDYWESNLDDYKNIPAFAQIYTETVALAFERSVLVLSPSTEKQLVDAKKLIVQVINYRDYPKFYSTYARLLNITNDISQMKLAIKEVVKAITKEDSMRDDYSMRIAEYELIKQKIEFNIQSQQQVIETNKLIEQTLNEKEILIKQDLDGTKKELLSMLGFFTAVLALILSQNELTKNLVLEDQIILLFTLSGTLILSFGTLTILLEDNDKKFFESKLSKYVALGFLMIVLAGGIAFINNIL